MCNDKNTAVYVCVTGKIEKSQKLFLTEISVFVYNLLHTCVCITCNIKY